MKPIVSGSRLSWIYMLLTLLLLTNGCRKKAEDAPEVSVTVQAAHPTQEPISEEITVDALLAPVAQAAISPRISAPIRAEFVQRGDHVRPGQLLVTLENLDLQGSALDSKGALASAQANYKATTAATIPEDIKKAQLDTQQLKVALDVATRTSSERRKLYQQGALSGRDADAAYAAEAQAQAAYDVARQHAESTLKTTQITEKESAQGQLTSAKGRLENAEAQVGYTNLRSPIAGVVTERPLFPGETAPAGTPVIIIMDTSALLAKLHIAQATAQKLSLGRKAEVRVPGMEESVQASVFFISPALDPGSTTVEVWLKLPNLDGHLKVGSPVHAVILGKTINDALQVPAAAILPSTDGGTAVMVIAADGTAKKQAIKIGIRTPEAVQVTSGLSLTDIVVTEGGYGLDDGTKVTVGKTGSGEERD
jgi:multidrug efflux pump subunit AcrA (membrane-fusion protein)